MNPARASSWWRNARARRALRLAAVCVAFAPLALAVGVWLASFGQTFPDALRTGPAPSTRVLDRDGHLLGSVRRDGKLAQTVRLDEISDFVVPALLAAEDRRFFEHPGVDPLAVVRAAGQALLQGRIVSGASTLTQQLARSTFERPRSLRGKLAEMALALCIERELDKRQILEAYLNRLEFGPNILGVEAAAQWYFAKPARALSLSEAATLVSIPRGPSLYDPRRDGSPILRRRNRVLERLERVRPDLARELAVARSMPLDLHSRLVWPGAHHWVRRHTQEHHAASELQTTLDSALERRVETIAASYADSIRAFGASALSVLVVDNGTREVLAYVGSADYADAASLGQNDGVTALRQPGSLLKPFIYGAAMERLGFTAATLLPDVEMNVGSPRRPFIPRNYDGHFRGPVRLREALASSLNVPAAYTAARLGVGHALDALHRFGFSSLTRAPDHYGPALALGDGEVTLEELAAAYVALANGGQYAPLRRLRDAPPAAPRRALSPSVAALLTDILSDPRARATAFGRHGPLEFSHPVAVKTGTSKGSRDNWTVGFSEHVTVAVWVGNFDGTPMRGASGVSGAGPLFREVMNEATRSVAMNEATRSVATRAESDGTPPALRRVSICALSGLLPTELCRELVFEWFIPGTEPNREDDMHQRVFVADGRLARDGCPGAFAQTVEVYPDLYLAWAREARRPLAPDLLSETCPPAAPRPDFAPRILFPRDGARYDLWATSLESARAFVFEVSSRSADPIELFLDGRRLAARPGQRQWQWTPERGRHTLVASSAGGRSEPVRFAVD